MQTMKFSHLWDKLKDPEFTTVARVKGTDQRSIDKYITMLVDLGVLTSPIPVPNSRKIIFTVDFSVLEEEKIQSRGDVK